MNDYNRSTQTKTQTNINALKKGQHATTFNNLLRNASKFEDVNKVNDANTVAKIAVRRSDNNHNNFSNASQEFVLVNGRWDTSTKIPTINAIILDADLEEFQSLPKVKISSSTTRLPECKVSTAKQKTPPPLPTTVDLPASMSNTGLAASALDTPSPLGSDSGFEGDTTDGNLSWLLNYKINELPPVPDQLSQTHQTASETVELKDVGNATQSVDYQRVMHEPGNYVELPNKSYETVATISDMTGLQTRYPMYPQTSSGNLTLYPLNVPPKKPPFTYTELIEHALIEKGELTVSGIYQWISDHFPYYKQNDDRWKNSVRHNLSINPHFRKGSKAVHGAGHLWTIAQKDDEKSWQIKRQRIDQFIHNTIHEYSEENLQEIELANATASIMDMDDFQPFHPPPIKQPRIHQPQNVAVEYVIDMSNGLGEFLYQPVSAEEIVEESGLGNYYITDLNPNSFTLNLSESDMFASLNYDELNFQTYELHEDEGNLSTRVGDDV